MPTDLARLIHDLRIHNTHEHQIKEEAWLNKHANDPGVGSLGGGPRDVLVDLFSLYERADLNVAGASNSDIDRAFNPATGTLEERWALVAEAWKLAQFTGYGEAVRLHARELYGIDEITPRAMRDAQPKLDAFRKPGQRLTLLRDVARLDHIQVDDFVWACLPDASGPDFFLYDLSVVGFASGNVEPGPLFEATGVRVHDIASLREALAALFAKYGPIAIAVKSQHAYGRTLAWSKRTDAQAQRALWAVLRDPKSVDTETRLCLGDWCIDRVAELCAKHRLPFKIHTGYYAGSGYMQTSRIPAGHLCDLLIAHPGTNFVLMHIAYPYHAEMAALAKHFPNAFVDLCWAWSIDPYSVMEFVRRFIHSVPINKLLAHGGDTFWPTRGVAYAQQTRLWLTRTLEREVADGYLAEPQAMAIARRILQGNQEALFDLAGRRKAIHAAMKR
ncbi:MAG: amidohydrolase family protein [Planctomycetota bacterium]|nr:amidohydrolase family protein [Planctomycetota bacterium]